MASAPTNERRYVRVKCHSEGSFEHNGREHQGMVRDISLCGLYFMTELPVELGTKVRVTTALPSARDTQIQLRGRIVRIVEPSPDGRGEQAGFGLDFGAMPLKIRTVIDNYVRDIFRAFRRAQFELAKVDCDETLVREILQDTYLMDKGYGMEALKDIVAAELKTFRLRPV